MKQAKASAKPSNVVNLMDALKRSIGESAGGKAPARKQKAPLPAAKKRAKKAV